MVTVHVLLFFLCVVVEIHSQTYPFVRFGNTGPALSNHSYVNLTAVGNSTDGSDSVQCHTDLETCCNIHYGDDRGDWYLPDGTRLGFVYHNYHTYEKREAQRVDLRRKNNGVTNGIYQCAIETNATVNNNYTGREIVYVGLYASGGKIYSMHINIAVCK